MTYTPLCVIGASRIATHDELFTVCTTVPEGLISTNWIGTATLGSAAIEIACVPVGRVMLLQRLLAPFGSIQRRKSYLWI